MILDDIVKAQWTPYGIQASSPSEAKVMHKFLREAVLDRHICLHKVIGFRIASSVDLRVGIGTYIARHLQIGESYPQMIVNLQDKVFLNMPTDEAMCQIQCGVNTLENNRFSNSRDVVYSVLYTDPIICRCLYDAAYLNVKLLYSSGYRSMQENSKLLEDTYFPCYTDYSLQEYVRVLPRTENNNLIPVRFYNGMTSQLFTQILSEWRTFISMGNLNKEEALWVQHGFMQ